MVWDYVSNVSLAVLWYLDNLSGNFRNMLSRCSQRKRYIYFKTGNFISQRKRLFRRAYVTKGIRAKTNEWHTGQELLKMAFNCMPVKLLVFESLRSPSLCLAYAHWSGSMLLEGGKNSSWCIIITRKWDAKLLLPTKKFKSDRKYCYYHKCLICFVPIWPL